MQDPNALLIINTILLLLASGLVGFAYREVRADIKENRQNWHDLKTIQTKQDAALLAIKKSVRIIAKETNVNIGDD